VCSSDLGNAAINIGFYDVDFADLRHGWTVGSEGIVHTADGGSIWTVQDTIGSLFTIPSVEAVDSVTAWVCGREHGILHTTDGGETWNNVSLLTTFVAIRAAHFGSNYVWVAGLDVWGQVDTAICRSSDGGASWTCYPVPEVFGFTYDMEFVDANNGWRVGGSDEGLYGFIAHTSDGGQTWVNQYDLPESAYYAVSFVDSLHGWVCTYNSLLKTVDGGIHWDSLSGPSGRVSQVQFLDTLNGWALYNWAQPYRTADGGSTWQLVPSGAAELGAIDFVDFDHGWAVSPTGVILRFNGTPSSASHRASSPAHTFALSAFPNPFNPVTTLAFTLPVSGMVQVKVFDVTGRLAETLANKFFPQGQHRLTFDGTGLSSGIYFARLQGGDFSRTTKLMLLR
jgi:photosystem II stability/assembly factor-like uncharacterized protein